MAIVMADDDLDDCRLVADAWEKADCSGAIEFVTGGAELLERLRRRSSSDAPQTDVVLLDLNMPGVDRWAVLAEMAAVSFLSSTPVVVLTTSKSDVDIRRAYAAGASGFVTKPALFSELVKLLKTIDDYWFGTSTLPGSSGL